jgi:enamine deaminase RidA (YjgF/YER057c/UK114 family)
MMRENFTDGTPYEPIVGFSRAVRAGDHVFVSGTAGWDEQRRVPPETGMYEQARLAIRQIERALERAGAKLSDVVRTRIYTTDMSQWEEVARAHREAFGAIGPAATLVEVTRLASPDMLVEIEADAVIGHAG